MHLHTCPQPYRWMVGSPAARARNRLLIPLIACVCGGPAARGTENACRGGCTVNTTTGGRAYVTCTALRPRRDHGRRPRLVTPSSWGWAWRSRAGRSWRASSWTPSRHPRLPHRDRHAASARRQHRHGALPLRPTRPRARLPAAMANELGLRNVSFKVTDLQAASIGQLPGATDSSAASASTRTPAGWPTSAGRRASSSPSQSRSAEPRKPASSRIAGVAYAHTHAVVRMFTPHLGSAGEARPSGGSAFSLVSGRA